MTEAGKRLFARLWAVATLDDASKVIANVQHDIFTIEAEARALPSTPTDPQRFSLELYATDALVPDPDGEWVRYRE